MRRLAPLTLSSRNPHVLADVDGGDYFLLGDTAWELFHRTKIEEAIAYLDIRQAQGFTMVWAAVLAEFDGLRTPNVYGEVPLVGGDPARPNEAYFAYVDSVIEAAAVRGLDIGLLPTWGDKLTAPWGEGPRIFRRDNLLVSREYGRFLGKRYSDCANILWVLGGDRPPKVFGEAGSFPRTHSDPAGFAEDHDWTPIWSAMASGLREGGGNQLITYHPQGGPVSTSMFLHHEDWLDINSIQSGHGGGHDSPIWKLIERDYSLDPPKPTLDSEPNYEDHPVNPWPVWDPATGYFDDYDVRRQTYRSVFAGGCGVVYGHHSVWQFASDRTEGINYAKMDWQAALCRPGATHVGILRRLMLSLQFGDLLPDQTLLLDAGSGKEHARAMRSRSEQVAVIYNPTPRPLRLSLGWAAGQALTACAFDPRTGEEAELGTFRGQEFRYVPTADEDSVLILRVS